MPSYREFLARARERLGREGTVGKRFVYTRHAECKMRQYRLSRQKVEGVIRRPTRTEEGVAASTVAVMAPVSPKTANGKRTWKQEVWVMFKWQPAGGDPRSVGAADPDRRPQLTEPGHLKIISAWRYPGVSPERDPIPADILREVEEGCILESCGDNE